MEFKKPVTALIRERRSVRNYSLQGLTAGQEDRIRGLLGRHTTGPLGNRVSFHLVHKPSLEGKKVRLGTYGFIKGARYFITGTVRRTAHAEEDYGYLLEVIILYLLDMGLGTCWLGGTFRRSEWAQVINLPSGEVIPAITPVGYPAPSMSNREKLIRKGAGSDQRKPWEELFFDGEFGEPNVPGQNGKYDIPLEMVRLAPSASNKQPWRIVASDGNFHFFLSRTPGYGGFTKDIDLQRIDMGIAMAHFELACGENGIQGRWEPSVHGISPEEGVEYIVSWVDKPNPV